MLSSSRWSVLMSVDRVPSDGSALVARSVLLKRTLSLGFFSQCSPFFSKRATRDVLTKVDTTNALLRNPCDAAERHPRPDAAGA